MKIAIVGTGAMGSVYAAMFAEAGHDVWAIDSWADHVEAIRGNGLAVTGFTGDRTVAVNAATSLAEVPPCEMYVIATKVAGVDAAAEAIAGHLSDSAFVVTIQNGLGAADHVVRHVPAARILLGVAQGFGASIIGPGHAHQHGMQLLRIGELVGGGSDRLREVERLWASAGFPAQAYVDIRQLIWEKFICNVAVGGPCLVAGLTIGELVASDEWRPIAMGCATEAHAVALAEGVALSFDDPVAWVDAFVGKMPDAKPSMLQDHEAGRRSEIDAINAQVPARGRAVGIPTPFNDRICAQVAELEAQL